MKIRFAFERDTKRTFRFAEMGHYDDAGNYYNAEKAGPQIGVLYVQKSAFDGHVPTEIEVDLKVVS